MILPGMELLNVAPCIYVITNHSQYFEQVNDMAGITKKILVICIWSLLVTATVTEAKVTLYTDEATYLNDLAAAGYSSFSEGFENDAVWNNVRSPDTAQRVNSQNITWTSNHDLTNDITTGNGAAVTGNWGMYDPLHGVATGTELECDMDTPPVKCLYHDGISGTLAASGKTLYGIGGWISGTSGAKLEFILDQISEGQSGPVSALPKFFGIIKTEGFSTFELRETEGKIGDQKNIFADDFTFAISNTTGGPPTGSPFPWAMFMPAILARPALQ